MPGTQPLSSHENALPAESSFEANAKLTVVNLQTRLIGPLSFDLGAATTACLDGPSGSGKTLLLRAIADLDPHQGTVSVDQESQTSMEANVWRQKVAYVPAVTAWWTRHVPDHFADPEDLEGLRRLGLNRAIMDTDITRLSSGERQRLGLLRALQLRPEILLLDEPTANLDESNTRKAEGLLLEYQQETGASILWVSHSVNQQRRVAAMVLRMIKGRLER